MFIFSRSVKDSNNLIASKDLKSHFLRLTAVLLALQIGMKAHASETDAGSFFGVALPWSLLESKLQSFVKRESGVPYSFRVPASTRELQGLQFQIGEMIGTLEGELSPVELSQAGLKFEGSQIHLGIRVQGLKVDQIIERIFDGNRIRIRVQAQCEPIDIQVRQGSSSAQYRWTQGELGLTVQNKVFQVEIPMEAVVVSEPQCHGIDDLGAEVKAAIATYFRSPERIETLAKKTLEDKMNELLQKNWERFQIGSLYQIQPNGVFVFRKDQLQVSHDPGIFNYRIPQGEGLPSLVITQKNLDELIIQKLGSASRKVVQLNQFSGFQKLLSSRFLQFFAWPDLMNFSKSAKFEVETKSMENLSLQRVGANLQAAGIIRSTLRGQRKRLGMLDYMNLVDRFSGNVESSVASGQLNLDLFNIRTQRTWDFAKEYISKHNPNRRISSSVWKQIDSAIQANRKTALTLPVYELEGQPWVIQSVRHQESFANFSLENH